MGCLCLQYNSARDVCYCTQFVFLKERFPTKAKEIQSLSIIEYLKKTLTAKQHQFATAHLEHKLSSGILVNLSFINRIPRAVLPVLWQERRVIIVRDDSMTSKGKTKQTASHIKERRRLLNSDSSANG